MISFEINGEHLDLYGDEVIAQTFAINNIAEIENRNGGYSNTFKAPATQKNLRLTGRLNDLNVIDDSPYSLISCNCWEDGMIIKKGFLQIDSFGEDIEFTFSSDNTNWFDLIKGKSIRDLDLSEYDHIFNTTNVFNSKDNTEGYIYPVIDYGTLTTKTRNGTSDVQITEVFPAAYVHTLIKKIFSEAGYKLSGSFANNVIYKKLVLPFVNELFGHSDEYIGLRSAKAIKTTTQSFNLPNDGVSDNVKFENDSTGEGYDGDLNLYDNILWKYTPDEKMKVTVSISATISNYNIPNDFVFLLVYRNDTDQIGTIGALFGNGAFNASYTFTVDPGYYYTVKFVNPQPVTITFDMEVGSALTWQVEAEIQEGSTVQLAPNLPDIDQDELIKDIFNRYQIITYTDSWTKTIFFDDFGLIYRNIPQALDWSDKIDLSEKPITEYQIGEYGQKNYFTHTQDDDEEYINTYNGINRVAFGDGVSEFDNEYLESEHDVYESPFAPSICHYAFAVGSEKLYLPYINKPSGEEAEPRIMIYFGLADVSALSGSSISSIFYINSLVGFLPFCYFVKKDLGDSSFDSFNDGLAFDTPGDGSSTVGLLEKYFTPVKNLLEKPKLLRIFLRLKAKDILELDHTVPVYLKKYKAYFYVNSVNEYTGAGESTEVELIKL
jgi:hypothetical protein